MLSCKLLLVGANFSVMFLGAAVLSQQAYAKQILLKSPSAKGSYYGMYCSTCIAASFSLSGRDHVSAIDVVLRTPSTTSFTTFDFSLQNSLSGSITTFASEAITVPLGVVSTDVFTIGKSLRAGTYYLVGNVPGYFGTPVTPGDVDGWLLSDGAYDNAAGTVTNGLWSFNGSSWVLVSGDYYNNGTIYYAPAFTVKGRPIIPLIQGASSDIPEPPIWSMMLVGFVGLGFAGYRCSSKTVAFAA